ncbi:uncharacterized protein UDID_18127 [Ustilago sp. UG-2017a]|nr:uncharacterized protein UDID_18127 [Ustilago sp. UG-2017a]
MPQANNNTTSVNTTSVNTTSVNTTSVNTTSVNTTSVNTTSVNTTSVSPSSAPTDLIGMRNICIGSPVEAVVREERWGIEVREGNVGSKAG